MNLDSKANWIYIGYPKWEQDMRVQIAKWGNSTGLRLPKAIVEELGLKPGQEMEISVKGGEARLRPVKPAPVTFYRIEDIVAEMKRLGPQNEPPLEDWGRPVGAEIIDDDGYDEN